MGPEKIQPHIMSLLDEAYMLASRLEDKLQHVLLPAYPSEAPKNPESASDVTRKLQSLCQYLGQLNDRVEG